MPTAGFFIGDRREAERIGFGSASNFRVLQTKKKRTA
jgi:hypothetical protein